MKQKLWAIIAFLYCFMLGITAQQNNQKQRRKIFTLCGVVLW